MSINILDENTINKIAAGEVIERPASIVKELVENSIDSGASSITLEIKDGGIQLIRITDNGCGINRDDIRKAFLRHATSKIKNADDINNICTLGFRGEALSSIASIAKVEMITKRASDVVGSRYVIEGGVEKVLEDVGAPNGTTIIVRDIFYNTPVRKKFLKSATTEGAKISEIIESIALSYISTSFRFISSGNMKLHTSGNGKLRDIIHGIYGKTYSSSCIEIDYDEDGISIKGYIGKPEISRGNRNLELYFINGRYIKSSIISKAIEDGYGNLLMQRQYPFVVLQISCEPSIVDVNVHPTKMDVRFSDSEKIYEAIKKSIYHSLHDTDLVKNVGIDNHINTMIDARIDDNSDAINRKTNFSGGINQNSNISDSSMSQFAKSNVEDSVKSPSHAYSETKDFDISDIVKSTRPQRPLEPFEANSFVQNSLYINDVVNLRDDNLPDKNESIEDSTQPRQLEFLSSSQKKVIGQVFDTYWMLEFEDVLYIIDQHAAHEKINYEKILEQYNKDCVYSQRLSVPQIVTLSSSEEQLVKENTMLFEKMGYEIEHFGGKEYAINAIPAILPSISKAELFKEMLGELSDFNKNPTPHLLLEKIASMSCKAAIKGNQKISEKEVAELFEKLLELDDPYNCPHGRPTIIKISKNEMEKKFKRIV